MCAYVYVWGVCMCVFMYVFVCTCMCMHVHACMHNVFLCMHSCMCGVSCLHTSASMYASLCVYHIIDIPTFTFSGGVLRSRDVLAYLKVELRRSESYQKIKLMVVGKAVSHIRR